MTKVKLFGQNKTGNTKQKKTHPNKDNVTSRVAPRVMSRVTQELASPAQFATAVVNTASVSISRI